MLPTLAGARSQTGTRREREGAAPRVWRGNDWRSAMSDEQDDTTIYKVVMNDEEQYSIWPEYRDNPLGWQEVGRRGTKDECLSHIEEVWTDMRPLSLRRQMAEQA
jgi:MbtH protein